MTLPTYSAADYPGLFMNGKESRIMALARQLRAIAAPVGSMSPLWDRILDMEAFVAGEPTVLQQTADEWIGQAEDLLARAR